MAETDAAPRGRVTALVPDPRRPGAVRILVEGRLHLTVAQEALGSIPLAIGAPIDPSRLAALSAAADEEAAFRTALRCLERRGFAARDLARRLVQKGHPPAAADGAVQRALALGVLDDERFARHYVESRSARGRGPARLRRELQVMGIAQPILERVLALHGESIPEQDQMVRTLAARRASQLRDLPRSVRVRRVVAYLARRGYSGPEVRQVVREVAEPRTPAD